MSVTLTAQTRTLTGKNVKSLRRRGLIPAILAGHGFDSREVSVTALEFERVHRYVSPTTLMDVVVDDEIPVKALLQKVQRHPRTNQLLHLEFKQVNLLEMMKAEVGLHLDGEAPAVTLEGGTLIVAHSTVEIRSNASNLVANFHVDLSALKAVGDHVRAGDLVMPEGVELLTDPETILVSVIAQRREEAAEAVAEEADAASAVAESAE